jgi:membrane protein YqaA with SNARE-associated domain
VLRAIYDWAMRMAQHRHATWAVAVVSFLDSSILPIPPDVIMLPMMVADRRRVWRIAFVATVASVLGAVLGYAIGYFLYETLGRPIIEFYGYGEDYAAFQDAYNEWGAWIVAGGGLTPIPFKIVTIASGVTRLDITVFLVASVLARAARFYAEAALLWYFGPWVRGFVEKRLGLVSLIFFVSLVGAFVVVRYLI